MDAAALTSESENDRVSSALPVSATNTPPTFPVMTEDDVGVPSEMHLYPNGGHGYELRRTDAGVTSWSVRMSDWMRTSGWLNAAK